MKKKLKIILGIVISTVFLYLALRQVSFEQMINSIKQTNLFLICFIIFIVLFSAWLRALRWRYFLFPIKKINLNNLFSSLLIGYAANFILPAHLGEFVRAYILGKKENVSSSSVLATIITERIIDMVTLLIIVAFTLLLYPFPEWVTKSSYMMFGLTIVLILLLFTIKSKTEQTKKFTAVLLKFLPRKVTNKVHELITSFADGLVALNNWRHYVIVFILSISIWIGYTFVFYFGFLAFGFSLPWIAPFVLVIFVSISIVVPSSPGYIGTYHFLCQLALGFFGVEKSSALGFAFVIHGLNTIPFLALGLILAWYEGISITKMSIKKK